MFDIAICARKDVTSHTDATHILSLLDPGIEIDDPSFFDGKNRLRIDAEDIDSFDDYPTAPTMDQVQEIIDWSRNIPDDANLLVHCEAGISRSSAAMLVILTDQYDGDYEKANRKVRSIRHGVCPNLRICFFGDMILETGGLYDLANSYHIEHGWISA